MILMLLALGVQLLNAQQKTVSGTVSDENGLPLPGATVIRAGTSSGTSTDFDGNYQIKANVGDVLEISYVGYATQSITVGASSTYNVSMALDNTLDEVIVTGVARGTSTKKLGFSVGKVNKDDLQEVPAADPANALRGKVSGVRIVQASGNPASSPEIRLRGSTSISGNQRPLLIVDGIITDGDLKDIAVEDIESMEVIKGAAAASLYGSLAGNGVIQIITKKGKGQQDMKTTLRFETGFSGVENDYPLANVHPYKNDPLGVRLGDWDNDPTTPMTSNFGFDLTSGSRVLDTENGKTVFDNRYLSKNYDNPANIYTNQLFSTSTVSVEQGQQNFNYFLSFQDARQKGIIEPLDPYKRNSIRANFGARPTEKLTIDLSASFIKSKGITVSEQGQGGSNYFYSALTTEPFINLKEKDADGKFSPVPAGYKVQGSNFQNPLYVGEVVDFDFKRNRILGGINLKYDITENLYAKLGHSIDRRHRRFFNYYPKGFVTPTPSATTNNGNISIGEYTDVSNISSAELTYFNSFGDFNFATTAKYLYEDRDHDALTASGYDFIAEGVINVENTLQENQRVSSEIREEKTRNYFLNLDLDYKEKIILSGLVRRDESSLFGEENRSRIYGRGAIAYRLSEDVDINGIDEFKIRASYGTSGQRPNWYAQYETYSVTPSAIEPRVLGNKKLLPSVSAELEAGVNIAFLNRFNFEFNYSNTKTRDDFILVPLTGVAGFSHQWQNVGEIESTYYEASLGGNLIQGEHFNWDFNLNFDTGNQMITDLNGIPAFTRGSTINENGQSISIGAVSIFRVEEGQPYGTMYGNKYATSLDQLTLDANGIVLNTTGIAHPGGTDAKSEYSVNSDGYVVRTADIGTSKESPVRIYDEDLGADAVTRIGNTNPDFNIGLSNSFSYKNFSLFVLLDYQHGGDIYNYTKQLLYYNMRHKDLQDWGAQDKDQNYAQNIYNASNPNSHFVEDGTYMKVREISLAFRKKLSKTKFFDALKVQISGRNLFTFTKYTGWDPEVAISTNPTNFRLDEYSYPNFRSFSATVQLEF